MGPVSYTHLDVYKRQINNRALLILAQDLGKTELLEYVRRNLEMMPVFYHTDFSIFTENSRRQDKGTAPYAEKYAYQYLLCGHALHLSLIHIY